MFLADLGFQDGNSCAQMRGCVVKKFQHERVPFERLLHDTALHTYAAAVDKAHFVQPCGMSLRDVILDHRWDVPRRKRVQIERAFDGDPERVLILHFRGVSCALPLPCRNGRSLPS